MKTVVRLEAIFSVLIAFSSNLQYSRIESQALYPGLDAISPLYTHLSVPHKSLFEILVSKVMV